MILAEISSFLKIIKRGAELKFSAPYISYLSEIYFF